MEWKCFVISTVLCIIFFIVLYICSLKKERYEKFNSIMSTCIANTIFYLATLLLILLDYLLQITNENHNELVFLFSIAASNIIVRCINKKHKNKYNRTLIKSGYKYTLHGMLVAVIIYSVFLSDKGLSGYLLAFLLGSYIDFEADSLKTIANTLKENITSIILGFISTIIFLLLGDKLFIFRVYEFYIILPWIVISIIVLVYGIWRYKIKKLSKDT